MMEDALTTCLGKKPFPYMKFKWPFIAVSLFFMAMSVYAIWVKGINFGVDFRGGTKVVYDFKGDVDVGKIRELTEELNIGGVEVIRFGSDPNVRQFMLRAKYKEGERVDELIHNKLKGKFGEDAVSVLSSEVVGPKVGADLRKKGFLSLVFVCALIMVYVGFRFNFLFAPGAVVALIHDVLISLGFFVYLGKEFNLPILAALLTILGYSINDTIVIYDRIRENIGRLPKDTSPPDIVDVSLTETMSRTIVTSLTVLMVVIVLFYLGGAVLHDFAFCLIVGLLFGAYSSIFIASPVYLFLQRLFPTKGMKVTGSPQPTRAKAA